MNRKISKITFNFGVCQLPTLASSASGSSAHFPFTSLFYFTFYFNIKQRMTF